MRSNVDLSVIVPVYNEEECIHGLYAALKEVCNRLNLKYEIIFIDDGSTDTTYVLLARLHDVDAGVKVVKFRKNYGQSAAMAAGFRAARGKIVVSMDGDLQNDPADIPLFLAKLKEGYDVVCGWRKDRKDKFISRRIPSMIANWLIGKLMGVPIHDNGCSLKAYRSSIIKNVNIYAEMHRFIPALSTLAGARISEIVVNHHPRRFGRSKYGISRAWKVALDIVTVKMITGFASRPALWFVLLSLPSIVLGLLAFFVAGSFYLERSIQEWMVVSTVAFLCLFLGAHLLIIGVIGELFVNTGDYFPRKTLNRTLTVL